MLLEDGDMPQGGRGHAASAASDEYFRTMKRDKDQAEQLRLDNLTDEQLAEIKLKVCVTQLLFVSIHC